LINAFIVNSLFIRTELCKSTATESSHTLSHVGEVTHWVRPVVQCTTGVGQTSVGAAALLDHVTLETRLVTSLQYKHILLVLLLDTVT
jgi:hypothetical protein